MQIEDFKRWHWAILGIIAGLMFSFAWQDHDVVGDRNYAMAEVKQLMFEREALSKSRESGQPILQNVRVEPPVKDYQNQERQIVTGTRLRFNPKDGREYLVPFYYYASVPYQAKMPLPPGTNLNKNGAPPTVMDFLAAAKTTNAAMNFRYAWEFEGNWYIALWTVGGLVLVGGIWPTVLNVLLGAGLGRPPKTEAEKANEEYLKRFGKENKKKAKAALKAKGPTAADLKQLDSMNAALETELAGAGVVATAGAVAAPDPVQTPATPATVVPLTSDAPAPAAHERQVGETEEEFRKRFAGGDFYPVARGKQKK